MIAINNNQVVDALCGNCGCAAFTPSVGFTIGSNNIVFTQGTTFDAGDSLKRLVVQVFDKNGKQASTIMSGAGTGATIGTVTVGSGAVTSIPVSAGGSGYTVPPRVRITGGGGTGAIARANINSSGVVTSISIVNGGTGYSTAPTVTLVTNECEVSLIGMDMTLLQMKATLVSTAGCKADLARTYSTNAATTGNLGNINKQ